MQGYIRENDYGPNRIQDGWLLDPCRWAAMPYEQFPGLNWGGLLVMPNLEIRLTCAAVKAAKGTK